MIVIENGFVIDPAGNKEAAHDILIDQGRIVSIEKPGTFRTTENVTQRIDAAGLWVTPGFIDLHVHLREPGFEWKETILSGVQAAVTGGFTTVCCMPNTMPRNDCAEVTQFIIRKAKEAGLAKVFPIGAVSVGLLGKEMANLSELFEAGCVAFSDDGEPIYDSGMMRRALEWCRMLDVVISCHEEDKGLSCGGCMNESALSFKMGLTGMPKVAEDAMIARDIEIARATNGRAHICHVSTARSVELIRRAKNDGIRITAEVTPHHLVLTEDRIGEYDTYAKMSPPLREQEDVDALLIGLIDGTIDAVASDHAPHEDDSKMVEFSKASFGILGLQTSLPVLVELINNGKITRKRAIESVTSSAANAFGLKVGSLGLGMPADICIFNPKHSWTFNKESVRSKSTNSPFLNRELLGAARTVLVDGRVVVDNYSLREDSHGLSNS